MNKIRVNLVTDSHSTGRGIGFYAKNLRGALERITDLEITEQDPQLVHYPYFDLFYPTLRVGSLPTVVTIHDLTPLILKDLYPKGFRGGFNLFRQTRQLKKVSAVITDSFNSKNDLIDFLNIPATKIHVTHLAVNPIYQQRLTESKLAEIKQRYSLPDKFILYVGGANPNKNLPALVRSALDLDLNLVLVGSDFTKVLSSPVHPELKAIEFINAVKKTRTNLITPGFVPDEDLLGFYQLASLYCQPSLYEGFGLPLLEAMTAECLIVSSNKSSLPEIYPKDTIDFDPTGGSALKTALKTALSLSANEKQKKIKAGFDRSKDFSWDKTALLTAKVYRSLL